MYRRKVLSLILEHLKTKRMFIQILMGPRQIGKTTLVEQIEKELDIPMLFVSADDPLNQTRHWLESQWKKARSLLNQTTKEAILVVDEVQKIQKWSEYIKTFWDEDTRKKVNLKVLLLGSSALQLKHDSSESLAGRFEKIPVSQWSKKEMEEAFSFDLSDYTFFGGYPGAVPFIKDVQRWKNYIKNSIIESVLNVDILALHRVEKPALLRQLFYLSCEYSGQILSLNKILGQLQDHGNTATISHYLDLLAHAGLVKGIQKYSHEKIVMRASSPKLNVMDMSFMTTVLDYSKEELEKNTELKGRVIESLVGTHLLHNAEEEIFEVFYWNDGHNEVDFIVKKGLKILAIEVKSGRKSRSLSGMKVFLNKFPHASSLLVGGEGVDLETFLTTPVTQWF